MNNENIVGSDESLKGDTFGGIVVCACSCNKEEREFLISIGVKDSKKITDKKVFLLAEKIMEKVDYMVKSVLPKEYNLMHDELGNMTRVLDHLHRECSMEFEGVHVVDEYPGCSFGDVIEKKAESKYVEVAAASIIARYYALKQIEELSSKIGFKVPLGSTHVADGLLGLKKSGLDPKGFVKMHFKNVKKIFLGNR